MSVRMTLQLMIGALTMAIEQRRPPAGLIQHSDRGSQYASRVFGRVLADHGMRCSMRPGATGGLRGQPERQDNGKRGQASEDRSRSHSSIGTRVAGFARMPRRRRPATGAICLPRTD